MKVVIATGNYPPDIGGDAFLMPHLAKRLTDRGASVTVLTFSEKPNEATEVLDSDAPYRVVRVPRSGGPLVRWSRYRNAAKSEATHADVILGFSLVSSGVPLALARLKHPRKLLRLGGEFFWERYTDCGGELGIQNWMDSRHWTFLSTYTPTRMLLTTFDLLVYATKFQRDLHAKHFNGLPDTRVLEHECPMEIPRQASTGNPPNTTPFRLLFLGRFVRFKNLAQLFQALCHLPNVHLTVAGSGQLRTELERLRLALGLESKVDLRQPVNTKEKQRLFESHHLLVAPSISEIGPRVALEARAAGLPVLLTRNTGLSDRLTAGMMLRKLDTAADIETAIEEARSDYDRVMTEALQPQISRTVDDECDEWYEVLKGTLQRTDTVVDAE